MARVTVHIPDDVLWNAEVRFAGATNDHPGNVNRSRMITQALTGFTGMTGRAAVSERGRQETLRAIRAARAALRDTERTLVQSRPVKRSVRRYRAPGRPHRDA